MGKIKKIIENELIGGTQNTDVYPVTSTKAVYDENNERLDNILNRRGVVNISTNYNSEHTAEVLTLTQALSKVPSTDRVLGFQGKYLASDGWHTIIYIGDSLTSWSDTTKWIDLPDKILRSISKNATFGGIATPTTNPGTPDGPVFYFATKAGIYANFNSISVADGEAVILQWDNGVWSKEISGLGTQDKLSELEVFTKGIVLSEGIKGSTETLFICFENKNVPYIDNAKAIVSLTQELSSYVRGVTFHWIDENNSNFKSDYVSKTGDGLSYESLMPVGTKKLTIYVFLNTKITDELVTLASQIKSSLFAPTKAITQLSDSLSSYTEKMNVLSSRGSINGLLIIKKSLTFIPLSDFVCNDRSITVVNKDSNVQITIKNYNNIFCYVDDTGTVKYSTDTDIPNNLIFWYSKNNGLVYKGESISVINRGSFVFKLGAETDDHYEDNNIRIYDIIKNFYVDNAQLLDIITSFYIICIIRNNTIKLQIRVGVFGRDESDLANNRGNSMFINTSSDIFKWNVEYWNGSDIVKTPYHLYAKIDKEALEDFFNYCGTIIKSTSLDIPTIGGGEYFPSDITIFNEDENEDVISVEHSYPIEAISTVEVKDAEFKFSNINECKTAEEVTFVDGMLNDVKTDMHILVADNVSNLAINGNGHKINLYTDSFDCAVIEGENIATTNITAIPSLGWRFIDQNFNEYQLSKTEFWQSYKKVLDADFNELDYRTSGTHYNGIIYIPINNDWDTEKMDITNAYINWTGWFVSFNYKIVEIITYNGQKYAKVNFTHESYEADGDYYFSGNCPNVCIINCYKRKGNSAWIDINGDLYLPAAAKKVFVCSKSVTIKGFYAYNTKLVAGNTGSHVGSVFNCISIKTVSCYIDKCELNPFITMYSTNDLETYNSYQTIINSTIYNVPGYVLSCETVNSYGYYNYQHIENCTIKDVNYTRTNTGTILCGNRFLIKNNIIEDAGYCSILGGSYKKDSVPDDIDCYSEGIIEHNIMGQSAKYYIGDSYNNVCSDSGCIHMMTVLKKAIIRYNIINRYNGRGSSRGIFCDDACSNIYIYENIVRGTPNGYSIDVRYTSAEHRPTPSGFIKNSNRLVARNIVDSGIKCQGVPGTNTNVLVYSNIIFNNNMSMTYKTSYANADINDYNKNVTGKIDADGIIYTDFDYNPICSIESPFKSTNIAWRT